MVVVIYKLSAPTAEIAARVWWVLPGLCRCKVSQVGPRSHPRCSCNGKPCTGVDRERSPTPCVKRGRGDLQLSRNMCNHNSTVQTRPSSTAKAQHSSSILRAPKTFTHTK